LFAVGAGGERSEFDGWVGVALISP
jgi:hypothetical protein